MTSLFMKQINLLNTLATNIKFPRRFSDQEIYAKIK